MKGKKFWERQFHQIVRRRRHKRFLLRLQQWSEAGKSIHAGQKATKTFNDIWPYRAPIQEYEKRKAFIKIPEVFSFLEDPVSAIASLSNLHSAVSSRHIKHVHIDHSDCKQLDLCASAVMDILVVRARKKRKFGANFSLSGLYPQDERVKILLQASGLLNSIGHTDSILPTEIAKQIRVVKRRSGFSAKSEVSAKCDQASTALTDYVDSCLERSGAALSTSGKHKLSTLLSESISNSEEHSVGPWYVQAHFDRLNPEKEGGECHIVLVNFGTTIYESFRLSGTSDQQLTKLRALSDIHQTRGFFDLRDRAYNEETLWTLYALQEGVSRKRERRGNGTTYLIDFFMKLAGKEAKMCVISGKAYILFDRTYSLKTAKLEGGDRQVIAFNERNSLEDRPDDRYVWALPSGFPGTLISIRFTLKEQYLV
jgi:hypothetical protein